MISYKSTRGFKKLYSFSDVILQGIAPDGGLFVPAEIPQISLKEIKSLTNKSYQEIALFLLQKFDTDFSGNILRRVVYKAYSHHFDTPEITSLKHLKDNQYILELWHGPTAAFKDMALQLMPLLFSCAAKKTSRHYLILVATSGDTGKAALEGYKDLGDIKIIVLYPKKGVSKIQELSMVTQEGNNVKVLGVHGSFDDAQRIIKDVFNDSVFNKKLLEEHNTVLSSANSINWGRILPQIIYHIHGYIKLINKGVIKNGEKIDIAVPTGNFGNILAAFYGQKMGLPIRKLICASNENNVLTEVLETGVYDIKSKKLQKTLSPSMDILIASNFERLLYELTHDVKKVKKWMQQLKIQHQYKVDGNLKKEFEELFYSGWVSNKKCLENIKKVFDQYQYLLDPHTSVVQQVVEEYSLPENKKTPVIICSTAHWAKFPSAVYQALTGEAAFSDEFKTLKLISKITKIKEFPEMINGLNNKKIIYKDIIRNSKEDIEKIILKYIQ